MSTKVVYIVSAVRTPIGSFGGSLKDFSATQLGAIAIKGAINKAGIDGALVNEVLMGCVIQANVGQAPARQAAKFAGLPDSVIATTVNKVCASGMKAIAQGAQAILLGDADIVVAGGMESMSNVPYYSPNMRWGNKYGNVQLVDGLAKDGLTDVYHNYAMGNSAELCAKECNISRADQDAFAIESYQRSQTAWNNGWFNEEIVPVEIPQRKGEPILFSKDEEPFNVKFDKIPELKSAFIKDGTVTAANASTMNDGAAAVVLMSKEKAEELGIKPLAIIKSYADAEQAPEWFTTTPSLAIPKAVAKAGLSMGDIDFVELNEAFSVVGIANTQKLGLSPAKVNVHGGAVSIGHPLGCSGARIIVTLINVLKQQGGKIGAAGICNGGGGASAMVIELA
ncbi:MAG TPA: acetyl-CoA C-acyltransferase [Sediminibacterium sp.]|jgi:acetyl-CoA C-acetyltransferase|uniref:acetyl-CoA C-acyltransferase n=1 Tax=Sediminibacterium sp. TaxID=1917865 RepID=UPI000BD597A6|nr:acetyl-CoA C-acyltransferase [Sediminibacterium sp.]MBT9483255.1 acetyl-CoA C-acyltransferase [Sediminibacterium sp.]OYY11871.1 MAG: acetyl-CoA acetyltransferase [Sphingobacteriia bacterium 35-36-14]HQS24478.1 acetyl-CoA C-acyltransferase [Sediminibacterium sp.]HQS35253.1 acetyl-CoA C-acyltransferase [Sediminibacterium sp.]